MGKKQHQQDKLYLTSSEWISIYGGRRSKKTIEDSKNLALSLSQNVLPFNFCALSFKPFTFPVTTLEGYVFDFLKLMDYFKLLKRQNRAKIAENPNANREELKLTNPVTGTPLKDMSSDVFPLKFHKNNEEEYHCPITFKVFHERSHIVAIKSTGNVYSYEAVESLNLRSKHYKDLLTDEPFKPAKDLIVLREPQTLTTKLNIAQFKHVKLAHELRKSQEPNTNKKKTVKDDDFSFGSTSHGKDEKLFNINYMSTEMENIMKELSEKYPDELPEEEIIKVKEDTEPAKKDGQDKTTDKDEGGSNSNHKSKKRPQIITYAHYSKGNVAIGFTCSTLAPETEQKMEILDPDMVRYSKIKTKAYAQIVTNLGNLNIELHCEAAPRTCENFLKLAKDHFYDDLLFFRSIKHFVIQTGDPNICVGQQEVLDAEGKPSKPRNFSYWGGYIADELAFAGSYPHKGRGIISAANTGKPNTNGSQFFITYRTAASLDKKHTVFGRVVGGLQTLDEMERVSTDPKTNRPISQIYIQKVIIYKDPYEALDENEEMEYDKRKEEDDRRLKIEENKKAKRLKPDSMTIGANREKRANLSGPSPLSNTTKTNVGKYLRYNNKTK